MTIEGYEAAAGLALITNEKIATDWITPSSSIGEFSDQ